MHHLTQLPSLRVYCTVGWKCAGRASLNLIAYSISPCPSSADVRPTHQTFLHGSSICFCSLLSVFKCSQRCYNFLHLGWPLGCPIPGPVLLPPKHLTLFPYFCLGQYGEGNGTPLQYSCLENPMDREAWKAAIHGVAEGRTRLSNFTFTFHFHALEKEMATHSSVLAWRIPGMGDPGGLPSMGSHRVGHD